MNCEPKMHSWEDRLEHFAWQALRTATMVVGLAAATTVSAAPTAITQLVAGMNSSGSVPFDAASGPGKDASATDSVIRTLDYATYTAGYTITPADTGALLIATIPAPTIPAGYTGPANPKVGYFAIADMPTGCSNPSATAVADPPPAGVSGVTADGKKLYCVQPSPSSGNNVIFRMQIGGNAPNGAIQPAPTFTFSSANNPATSAFVPSNNGTTLFGMPDLTISAAPRWNLQKSKGIDRTFVAGSGPAGEDGYIIPYKIGLFAEGSRRGLEALASPVTITESFADPDQPNVKLVNWAINTPTLTADFSPTGLGPCLGAGTSGASGGGAPANAGPTLAGVQIMYGQSGPYDYGGGASPATSTQSVAKGGTCTVVVNNTPGAQTATVTLSGTDFSLERYPTRNYVGGQLVSTADLEATTNQWWVAHKVVLVWVPVTDLTLGSTEFHDNTLPLLTALSVTGQANTDRPTDNTVSVDLPHLPSGSMSKWASSVIFTYNMTGFPGVAAARGTSGLVDFATAGQVFYTYMATSNNGSVAFGPGYICDKIDNARAPFADMSGYPLLSTAAIQSIYGPDAYVDSNTGVLIRPFGSGMTPTVELGVGGPGLNSGGTWTSANNTASTFSNPATTGSAQADSTCSDPGITWYPSVAAVPDLNQVTRVRVSYPSYPGGVDLSIYVPQKVNATVAFSGSDDIGGAYAAGAPTLNMLTPDQALWSINSGGIAVRKASSTTEIKSVEYAVVAKSSPSNASGTLVRVGATVDYKLDIKVLTNRPTYGPVTVEVWDVFPPYLSYLPGSSKRGGVAIPDPVCASSGLPAARFPTQPLPSGAVACVWMLTNETATYDARAGEAAIGPSSGTSGLLVPITFQAVVGLTAPNNSSVLNTSTVDTPLNMHADAVYNTPTGGFTCVAAGTCRFSNHTLTISAAPGMLLSKRVDKTVVPVNTGFGYTLTYGAIGNSLAGTRIIDVLPYNADGRAPPSTYVGTLKLTAPIAAPAASAGPPATVADPDIEVRYTVNAPANINRDPYAAAAHDFTGAGLNSASVTNWCLLSQFGSANCPATIGDATGFAIAPRKTAAVNPGEISAGDAYSLQVAVVPASNAVGNVYSNDFVGDSPSLTARRPGSNIVTTRVVAPDLVIAKTANPTTIIAGQSTTFTLTASNNTSANNPDVGPIENLAGTGIRVTDPLPSGWVASLPITATNWNCAASTAVLVDCTYVGTLPIGVGGVVGSPISVVATAPVSTPNGSLVNNTASIAMTGQSELPTTNNSATASVTVNQLPDATITKTANPTSVAPGGTIAYTLRASLVAAGGSVTAGPVTVVDTLPADITIAGAGSVSGANWDCTTSAAPSTVSCAYTGAFPILPGTQIGGDITVNAIASAAITGTVSRTNTARVTVPGDTNSSNNSASATVTVQGTTTVAGRVYREASNPANAADDGTATDPGLVTQVGISCTPAYAGTTPVTTAADGTYSFSNVPIGANCTITETQPAGYTNAYNTPGSGGTGNTGGTAGSTGNSTITLTVPTAGSTGNNFAEQSADTMSALACIPSPANPTQAVTCTLTCTNAGPGAAVGASCNFTGTLPAGVTANSCPATSASQVTGAAGALSCAITFPAPLNGSVTVTGGSSATNDSNGGNVPTAGNNPSTATVAVNGVNVSGRVYREASNPANTSDDGNATDPGLVTQVAISCTPAYSGTTPITTATDGTYSFANVPAGANCTITETQPAGYTNAYNTPGGGGTGNTGGTAGSTGNSTITVTVPAAGSTGNNFAEQSADMVPAFSNVPAAVAPGATYSGLTLTCTNNGPGVAVAATCAPSTTTTGATVSAISCTPSAPANVSATAPNNTIVCTFSYTAPDTAGGADSPTQTVNLVGTTGALNDSNGGTGTGGNNQVALNKPVIDAVNDPMSPQQYSPTGSTIYPLLANDQLGVTSNPAVGTAMGQVTVTLQNNGGITGATIDATGNLVVPNNTPVGTYTATYQICTPTGLAAPQDKACDTATKVITVQASDMTSRIACTPIQGEPGTTVTCTVTCTNNGPNAATNAFCAVTNAPTLPGAPTPVCTGSPAATLAVSATLSCSVSFPMPAAASVVNIEGGTGADNDLRGGATATAVDNNASTAAVYPLIPVPALSLVGLLSLISLLGLMGLRRRNYLR